METQLTRHRNLRMRYDVTIIDRDTGWTVQRVCGETDGGLVAVKQGENSEAWSVAIGERQTNLELLGRALACTAGNHVRDLPNADRKTMIAVLGGWAGAAVSRALQVFARLGSSEARL